MASTNLSAQTYNGGTWYSLYDNDDKTNVVVNTSFCEKAVFAPAESITFEYKKLSVLSSNGQLQVQNKVNGNSWSGSKGEVNISSTSWNTSHTIALDANISHIRYYMKNSTGSSVRNHRVKLKKHILLNDNTSNGQTWGVSSITLTDNSLATAEGKTSTNYYTIKFRSFLASGDSTITSSNPEFHFGNGQESITLGVENNYCASANGSGNCSATTLGQISNYSKQIYFSPAVQHDKNTRSTTITISDGTSTAYIYLSAPVIPTYFFKAEAISSPAEGGTATATFPNGQDNCSVIATNYTTTSMSATVTFTAAPNTANGYVFEGWKTDPASSTFYKQGADKTTFTETITSSALNPNGLASLKTYYAIYSRRYTAKITGSNYTGKLVNDSWKADYQFVNTQTPTPTNSDADPFYFVINHDFTGNDTREGSPRPNEVIAYDPTTNTITALNEGIATITFYQKETSSHEGVTQSFTVVVNKYTPTFAWNAANATYYYGTSIPNIFSTTNPDVEPTFTSNNEAFARVENNTLYIANARETATITVTQAENYKWNGKTEQYVISPVNGNNHVEFTITNDNHTIFEKSLSGQARWKNNGYQLGDGGWTSRTDEVVIAFTGIPDTLYFDKVLEKSVGQLPGTYLCRVYESVDGINWGKYIWERNKREENYTGKVGLSSSTRFIKFYYEGTVYCNYRNIKVTERFQYEATPTVIDFGTNGINHGLQEETITFLHANAGRITNAVITGADATYFTVDPENITGTGRDLYGTATLKVTFDNQGEKRGKNPYNATLTISDNAENSIAIPLTGIREGKSTPVFIWNPNTMPYYFNTTIANIAYSTNKDPECPLTFATSDNTIAEVINGDLKIYEKGQEVTITVSQKGNEDYIDHTESYKFTPSEKPSLVVPFRVSKPLHEKSVQLGTKCKWSDDAQIQMADPLGDGFMWGDDRKRVLITFAGTPDKLYFDFKAQSSTLPPTPENATDGWIVEESPNGSEWTRAWKTSNTSTDWVSSGEIALQPNTQYVRFSYCGNFAGLIKNITISSLEGNSYLRAEEGSYLSRGAKWGTQAILDPFGMVCRVSHFTDDNTNVYTRFQFIDNMQYLWETHDTKEIFTDDQTAANTDNLWQVVSDASGKFTIQSGNDLGNNGQYITIQDQALTFTEDVQKATIWNMEAPDVHNKQIKNYMDALAAKAAEKDFGPEVNTLEQVRSNINTQEFEVTNIEVPAVAIADQGGEYRDDINGTFAVYDNTISGLAPGFYRLTVKALYRIADPQNAHTAKANNWESVLAYIYANDVKYPIQSVYTSYNSSSYDTSDDIYNGYSYPAQLNSAERAFEDINRYLNDVYVYVEADPGLTTGTLHYGIKNPSYVPGAWLAYSTITLTRFARKEYIFEGDGTTAPADWNIPAYWNRGDVPNQYHNVRIQANVNIDSHIEVYGVAIDNNAKIHISSTGGLTVNANGITNAAADGSSIVIDNTPEGAGFLRINPTITDTHKKTPRFTVKYTTRAYDRGWQRDEVWQYMGAPGSNAQINGLTDQTLIYNWDEPKGWVKQDNSNLNPMPAWRGYALTQSIQERATYQITATPILDATEIHLTCTPSGMKGDNLFVNSFAAPIDIKKIDASDIVETETGKLWKIFYLFNSGSWNQWKGDGNHDMTADGYDQSSAGHYYTIPILSASYTGDAQTVIPPMQGVYVYTETPATIRLNYAKHVWNGEASNKPMRSATREESDFQRVRIHMGSENSGADRMYIIQTNNTTREYDNGYDGDNINASGQANIYTNEPFGKMEVSCANNIDSMYIGITTGEDTTYTLTFGALRGEIYLKDLANDSIFEMTSGGQYHFTAAANATHDLRFQILLHPDLPEDNQNTTSDLTNITNTTIWSNGKTIYIANVPVNSIATLYNISGQAVLSSTINYSPYTLNVSDMPKGVYILRINNQAYKFVRE